MSIDQRLNDLERRLGSNSKERLAVVYRDPDGSYYDNPPGDPDRCCLSAAEIDELRETFETVFAVRFERKSFVD